MSEPNQGGPEPEIASAKARKWPWVLGAVAVVALVAGLLGNGAKDAGTASPASTATQPQSTVTVVPDLALVPSDVHGVDAALMRDRLKALGFAKVDFVSDDGKAVVAPSNWTVVSVDGAGTNLLKTSALTVRVAKLTVTAPPVEPAPTLTKPVEVPALPPAPPTAAPEPEPAYYKNCAEAEAAGAAPMKLGEPGYRAALDRDKDGVACED